MPEPSFLDARLAEIDRRLRTIQSGLAPVPDEESVKESPGPAVESAPEPPARGLDSPRPAPEPRRAPEPPRAPEPRPAPEPPRAPEPLRLVEPAASGDADRLADLVEAHERLLELHRELLSQYAEVLERRAGERATVSLDAGPFASAALVREFERTLSALPGVRAVAVREYVGDDRVQLDVQLTGD